MIAVATTTIEREEGADPGEKTWAAARKSSSG
jgi:hypothetical protein